MDAELAALVQLVEPVHAHQALLHDALEELEDHDKICEHRMGDIAAVNKGMLGCQLSVCIVLLKSSSLLPCHPNTGMPTCLLRYTSHHLTCHAEDVAGGSLHPRPKHDQSLQIHQDCSLCVDVYAAYHAPALQGLVFMCLVAVEGKCCKKRLQTGIIAQGHQSKP